MMTAGQINWQVVLALGVLITIVVAVVSPIVKLVQAIDRLNAHTEQQEKDRVRDREEYCSVVSDNAKEHDCFEKRLSDHDGILLQHDALLRRSEE